MTQRDELVRLLANMDDGLSPLHACDEATCPGLEQHADDLIKRGVRVLDPEALADAYHDAICFLDPCDGVDQDAIDYARTTIRNLVEPERGEVKHRRLKRFAEIQRNRPENGTKA